jgi:hypothetical protein
MRISVALYFYLHTVWSTQKMKIYINVTVNDLFGFKCPMDNREYWLCCTVMLTAYTNVYLAQGGNGCWQMTDNFVLCNEKLHILLSNQQHDARIQHNTVHFYGWHTRKWNLCDILKINSQFCLQYRSTARKHAAAFPFPFPNTWNWRSIQRVKSVSKLHL